MPKRLTPPTTPSPRVIVSYRPDDDDAPQALRLVRALRERFGAANVETDTRALAQSSSFIKIGYDVLIVIVGRVLHEPSSAVTQAARVVLHVPVARLRDESWEDEFEKLAAIIESTSPKASSPKEIVVDTASYVPPDASPGGPIFGKHPPVGRKKGGAKAPPFKGGGKKDVPAKPAAEPSVNAADVVACTVFAPPRVEGGEQFMVQVSAHLPEDAEEAARLAKEFDEDAERRGTKTLDAEVARGSRLTFDLSLPGFEVDEPRQSLVWRGRPESVQFGVVAPEGQRAGAIIGTVVVSQDSVPFGHVKFKIEVGASAEDATAPTERDGGRFVRYRKVFVSYASKDRSEVLKRVQMLAAVRLEYFQDLLSLEPGERWERALYKHIDDSDAFFLFWSKSAKRSKWVMEEVRYALARKAADESAPPEIVPVIIEGPPLVKPPKELADLHFNDKILYFIDRDKR